MVSRLSKLVVLFLAIAVFAACAHQAPIENIDSAPVPTGPHKLTTQEISKIIAKAAIDRGWVVSQTKPGTLHLHIERHDEYIADAGVTFDQHSYSIALISSQNLDQSGGMISTAYNRYVEFLKSDIDKGLNAGVFQ